LRPKGSTWYAIYIESPQLDNKKFHKKFRKRFRTPYSHFLELVRMVKESDVFKRWLSFDAIGKESSPIKLMVLGALRYLGRGWTFDDLEESTAIHEETHRVFFHLFVEWGSPSYSIPMLSTLQMLKKQQRTRTKWESLNSMAAWVRQM
jgi:hypothetical protein